MLRMVIVEWNGGPVIEKHPELLPLSLPKSGKPECAAGVVTRNVSSVVPMVEPNKIVFVI